jgi:hypothetical protein
LYPQLRPLASSGSTISPAIDAANDDRDLSRDPARSRSSVDEVDRRLDCAPTAVLSDALT